MYDVVMRNGRVLRCLALPLAVLATLFTAPAASASKVPQDASWEPAWVESADGTRLQADVFRPRGLEGGARTPVIVITGPYFGVGTDETDPERPKILGYYDDLFDVAFARGYSIVQVSLRGYGASDGCPDFGGLGEQADAHAAVEWAARQPWSNGRVGTWGLSYDAITQVMNLDDPPHGLGAAVIIEPSLEHYRAIYMNGVPYARGVAIPAYMSTLGLAGPTLAQPAPEEAVVPGSSARNPLCLEEAVQLNLEVANRDRSTRFWRERNYLPGARGSRVPVLWAQGLFDEQTRPDQFLPLWRHLEGPRRAWVGQFPHLNPGHAERTQPGTVGRPGFTQEAMDWYDRFLLGKRRVTRGAPSTIVQEGAAGAWRAERRWPPAGVRHRTLPVLPGTYVDAPGNKAEPGCLRIELNCPPGPSGVGSWTFSEPLPYPAHLSGVPQLEVTVEPGAPSAQLVALLYDVDPQRRASLISRGATLVPRAGTYSFRLYPQDWRLQPGHRVGLLLSGADDGWFLAGTSGEPVEVASGRLRIPYLGRRPGPALEGGPSQVISQRIRFEIDPAILAARTSGGPPPPVVAGNPRESRAEYSIELTEKRPNHSTGSIQSYEIRDPEGGTPPALRELSIAFPRGTRFNQTALPSCDASDAELFVLGAGACPENSRVGDGSAVGISGIGAPVDPVTLEVDLFNTTSGAVFVAGPSSGPAVIVARARLQGRRFVTAFPPVPGAASGGEAVQRSVRIRTERIGSGESSYSRTPARCPESGRWAVTARFTFADGGIEIERASVPCG